MDGSNEPGQSTQVFSRTEKSGERTRPACSGRRPADGIPGHRESRTAKPQRGSYRRTLCFAASRREGHVGDVRSPEKTNFQTRSQRRRLFYTAKKFAIQIIPIRIIRKSHSNLAMAATRSTRKSESVPIDSPERRRLPILLRHAWYGLNQAFRRRIADLGITPDQFTVLRTLLESGEITQRVLTELMSSDPNTVASLLERMEKAGLIERRPHEKDRRARRLHLLPTGKRKYQEARKSPSRCRPKCWVPCPNPNAKNSSNTWRWWRTPAGPPRTRRRRKRSNRESGCRALLGVKT